MEEYHLYISDEAIGGFGKEFFQGKAADDYDHIAGTGPVILKNRLILTRDDEYDTYLSWHFEDEVFTDVNDL